MKVLQSGRLGNFLFQWAFANHLALTNNVRTQIIFDRFHSDISQIQDLQTFFNSNKVVLDKRNLYGYGFKALDYLASMLPQTASSIRKILDIYTEGEPSTRESSRIYRGYFQDPKFALSLNNTDLAKLRQKIDSARSEFQSRNLLLSSINDYQAVHLRLGDFKNSSFGVLKLESMLKLLNPNLPTVICTDGSREEVNSRVGNNNFEVLTPSETNAWETLSVITTAKRVISSNSTMSWWGAFMANKNGAEVFLPSQWRKDDRNSLGMQFPGSKTFHSSFE